MVNVMWPCDISPTLPDCRKIFSTKIFRGKLYRYQNQHQRELHCQWRIQASRQGRTPSFRSPNSFIFAQFWEKKWHNNRLAHPLQDFPRRKILYSPLEGFIRLIELINKYLLLSFYGSKRPFWTIQNLWWKTLYGVIKKFTKFGKIVCCSPHPPASWIRPCSKSVADLRGAQGMRPPLGIQILSISCSFWENLAKSYVGARLGSWRPLLGEILDPPLKIILMTKSRFKLENLFNC